MTAVAAWLAHAPRTRYRLLETIASSPDTMRNVASRVTSTAYAPCYYRHLTALCDRGLVYERPDQVLVVTASGRNALSKARRVLRDYRQATRPSHF